VFDAPPERRREMLHNQALRDKFMRGHAATIADEVEGWWRLGRRGQIDLLDWFAELTIYTSSACLIGPASAGSSTAASPGSTTTSNRAPTHRLRRPLRPIESFRRRDAARVGLVELVQGSWTAGPPARRRPTRTATCSTC
jgi:sterol 14-demethylase